MAFIAVYKDPKKKRLQQIEIVLMVLFLPIGLYFGYGAYQQWTRFKSSEAHSIRGQELSHEGKVDEALKELTRAAEIYPENRSNWEAIGVIYHEKGAHQAEAAAYLSGIEALPEDGDLAREYGGVLHELGEHEKELEYLEKAEKLGTSDELFLSHLLRRAQKEADGTIEPSKAKSEGELPPLVPKDPAVPSDDDGHSHSKDDGHGH